MLQWCHQLEPLFPFNVGEFRDIVNGMQIRRVDFCLIAGTLGTFEDPTDLLELPYPVDLYEGLYNHLRIYQQETADNVPVKAGTRIPI